MTAANWQDFLLVLQGFLHARYCDGNSVLCIGLQNVFCPCIQSEEVKYLLVIAALKGRLLSIRDHDAVQNV